MSSTPYIPDEILVEIISLLSCRHMARVSCVSRRLNSISQSLLYNEPYLYGNDNQPSSFTSFIRTLLTPGCETLGTHVRRLTIDWTNGQSGLHYCDIASFKASASRFGLGDGIFSEEKKLMLLLHLLPCLHSLHLVLSSSCSWYRAFMKRLGQLQRTAMLPVALQSLREFKSGTPNYVKPEALVALLQLPHLHTLTVPICEIIFLHRPRPDAPALTATDVSNVTHLSFPYVRIPSASLLRILQLPRALTYFSYHILLQSEAVFDFPDFGCALHPLRGSLQTLVLDFSAMLRVWDDGGHRPPISPIGSLREWAALRDVRSSLIPLLGIGQRSWHLADVLPVGVKTLRILPDNFRSGEEVVEELVLLLAQKAWVVPALESVGVCAYMVGSPVVEERLRSACEVAGVVMADAQ